MPAKVGQIVHFYPIASGIYASRAPLAAIVGGLQQYNRVTLTVFLPDGGIDSLRGVPFCENKDDAPREGLYAVAMDTNAPAEPDPNAMAAARAARTTEAPREGLGPQQPQPSK